MLFVVDDRFRVEERNAVEFEQRVIERMRDVVADPFGHHHGDHQRQQERHVVCYLDLRVHRVKHRQLRTGICPLQSSSRYRKSTVRNCYDENEYYLALVSVLQIKTRLNIFGSKWHKNRFWRHIASF